MTSEPTDTSGEKNKPQLFSVGYRACDVLLLILLLGGPALVYHSVNSNRIPISWFHLAVLGVSTVAILGLLRVRVAFALLAVPFFVWAGYSVIRGFFFPPEWSDLVNPIYTAKWAVSIAIEYSIGAYFWKKYSGVEFLDWVGAVIERIKN